MSLLLVDLPAEVLERILAHVSGKDMKQLSLTSRDYRRCILPYVMRLLRVTWAQVLDLQRLILCSEVYARDLLPYCERLYICEPNAYNEYQQDTFGKLLGPDAYPGLRHVHVKSASLSHWLKYNKCSHVQRLQLENADLSNTRKVFCLEHVCNFANLTLLTLTKYHFDWLDLGPCSVGPSQAPLRNLAIHDCTWQYPFNLAQFNSQHALRALAITYSHNNSFVLLERFLDFLANPLPGHLESLNHLQIGFVGFTDTKKVLTLTIMATFLRAFLGLHHLHLYGWYTTYTYANIILNQMKFSFPVDLDVEIDVQGQSHDDVMLSLRKPLRWRRRLLDKD